TEATGSLGTKISHVVSPITFPPFPTVQLNFSPPLQHPELMTSNTLFQVFANFHAMRIPIDHADFQNGWCCISVRFVGLGP
ncbi:hypothetical protein CDAR_403651, partial [Caerostris darwini]